MRTISSPTRTRIVLLLCIVMLLFGLGLWAVQLAQRHQIDTLRSAHRQELNAQFDRLLQLKSESLLSFA